MANIDGVASSHVDIKLEKPGKEPWFDSFQTFGLLAYFAVLYAIYTGFFAALLVIALNVRKDNYLRLNSRLTGNVLSGTEWTSPWMWLKYNSA